MAPQGNNGNNSSDSANRRDPREDQAVNNAIEQAINAIAAGQSIASVESIAAGNLPSHLREKFKQALRAQLAKRGLIKQSQGQAQANQTEKKASTLRGVFAMLTKQAYEKIANLMRSRPDVAKTVQQIGKTMKTHGAMPEGRVSEAELGRIVPTPGLPGQAQEQEQQR